MLGPTVSIPMTLEAAEGGDSTVQVCVSLRLHPATLTTDNKFTVTLTTQSGTTTTADQAPV